MHYLPNTSTKSEMQETCTSLLNKMGKLLMPKFSTQFNGSNSKGLNCMTHIKHTHTKTQLGTTCSHKQSQLFGQAKYHLTNASAVSETN